MPYLSVYCGSLEQLKREADDHNAAEQEPQEQRAKQGIKRVNKIFRHPFAHFYFHANRM